MLVQPGAPVSVGSRQPTKGRYFCWKFNETEVCFAFGALFDAAARSVARGFDGSRADTWSCWCHGLVRGRYSLGWIKELDSPVDTPQCSMATGLSAAVLVHACAVGCMPTQAPHHFNLALISPIYPFLMGYCKLLLPATGVRIGNTTYIRTVPPGFRGNHSW